MVVFGPVNPSDSKNRLWIVSSFASHRKKVNHRYHILKEEDSKIIKNVSIANVLLWSNFHGIRKY